MDALNTAIYKSGYLTIEDYNPEFGLYRLDFMAFLCFYRWKES